jgi:hypothetical protein
MAALGALFVLDACSADAGGCKKDTDCAAGRICTSDGRCEDATSGNSSGSGSSSGSGIDCRAYVAHNVGCSQACECGTLCEELIFNFGVTNLCAYSCTSKQDCVDQLVKAGGPALPLDQVTCDTPPDNPSFCIFPN